MGCYVVPTVAAIAHFYIRKHNPTLKADSYQRWLNLLFVGGAIFGVVDHMWYGELFMLGHNPIADLMLGVVITVVTYIAWKFMVIYDKVTSKNTVSN